MLRVMSLNINGIRAGAKKGFFDWIPQQNVDVICLQETRATQDQLPDKIYQIPGYTRYFVAAEKKGYSGVAIYAKEEPQAVKVGFDWPAADQEGRYIQLDFNNVSIASLYLPSGTSGDERQGFKYEFLDFLENRLVEMNESNKPIIICGDWNIAHKKIDIKNWRGNQKNSGFLPEERAFMDRIFDQLGYVDAFRVLNQEEHQYTWWSNRGQAWANNTGWRIDYQVISSQLKETVRHVDIYKEQRFSDHAPLIIDYDLSVGA